MGYRWRWPYYEVRLEGRLDELDLLIDLTERSPSPRPVVAWRVQGALNPWETGAKLLAQPTKQKDEPMRVSGHQCDHCGTNALNGSPVMPEGWIAFHLSGQEEPEETCGWNCLKKLAARRDHEAKVAAADSDTP